MIEKAINKLKLEMDQNKNNPYIQFVGGLLLQELQSNPESAEKILTEGKTVAKSLDEMKKVAEKKPRLGNCAMLTPQEGFDVVMKYYGIKASEQMIETVNPAVVLKSDPVPSKTELDFDIGLEDLF